MAIQRIGESPTAEGAVIMPQRAIKAKMYSFAFQQNPRLFKRARDTRSFRLTLCFIIKMIGRWQAERYKQMV
jgi:hypothetical protein